MKLQPLQKISQKPTFYTENSFILNDIKNIIRNGGNVTHILNIKISKQPTSEIGNEIRRRLFRSIRGIPIVKAVGGMNVTITWRSSANSSSAYYHSDNAYITDLAVKEHTKMMLRDLLNTLDNTFNNIFSNGITGLSFIVTKPLTRTIVINDDDEIGNHK